jgi:hypothetical protein
MDFARCWVCMFVCLFIRLFGFGIACWKLEFGFALEYERVYGFPSSWLPRISHLAFCISSSSSVSFPAVLFLGLRISFVLCVPCRFDCLTGTFSLRLCVRPRRLSDFFSPAGRIQRREGCKGATLATSPFLIRSGLTPLNSSLIANMILQSC